MRGEGLGFPLRRHRHLLPAQSPPPLPGLHGHKTQNLLCVWVSMACPGAPWGWHCTASLPLPPSPASCALGLAAQMWPDSTAAAKPGVQQLEHICPRAGTGGGQPCLGGSHAPHFPAQFWCQNRRMKDVSIVGAEAPCSQSCPSGCGASPPCHPGDKDPLGPHLHAPQHPHCSGSRDLVCQRGEGWWNCPLQGTFPHTAGLGEEGTRTYSCWRGGFQRCLVRLSAS